MSERWLSAVESTFLFVLFCLVFASVEVNLGSEETTVRICSVLREDLSLIPNPQ